MNYKTTNKYFTQKNLLMYIGMGIAAVGLFFTFFWWWGFGAGIIAAGVACIIINREGLVKGEEVDAEINKKATEFEEKTAAAYTIYNEKNSIEKTVSVPIDTVLTLRRYYFSALCTAFI